MMKMSWMNVRNGFTVGLLAVICSACNMENWNWFGTKSTKTDDRPVTKARKPSDEPQVASADRPKTPPQTQQSKPAADDPKAKEVDEKVDRYVKSMNNTYDPNYESNDFQSKMRRQNDPARPARIKQTAAKSREQDGAAAEPDGSKAPSKEAGNRKIDDSSTRSPEVQHAPSKMDDSEALDTDSITPVSTTPKQVAPVSKPKSPPKIETPSAEQPDEKVADEVRKSSKDENRSSEEGKSMPSKPPVLGDVKASAGPLDAKSSTKSDVSTEKVSANSVPPAAVTVDSFKKRLDEQEAAVAKDPNNVEEQFKLRLIYLANGEDAKALSPTSGMNAEIQDIMQAQLKSLISARSSAQRDPSAWANKQLEAVEELRNLVRTRADLKVPRVVLCKAIEGYGRYTPFEPAEFKAGKPNRVLLYVEIDNFSTEKTASGQYRVLLTMRQSLLNKAGEELWNAKDENIEDLARQRRRDFYLTADRIVPKTLNPGEYVFKVEIEDVLAGKINSGSVSFKLVP